MWADVPRKDSRYGPTVPVCMVVVTRSAVHENMQHIDAQSDVICKTAWISSWHSHGCQSTLLTEMHVPGWDLSTHRGCGFIIEVGDGVFVDTRQLEVAAEGGPIFI